MPSSSASRDVVPDVAHHAVGRHAWGDLEGCKADVDAIAERALRSACERAGATVLHVVTHRFEPQGCSVVALLAESHATVHTYPEHGVVFVDAFTCGTSIDPATIVHDLHHAFGAERMVWNAFGRGGRRTP